MADKKVLIFGVWLWFFCHALFFIFFHYLGHYLGLWCYVL